MVTRAIIEEVINKYNYRVRIPKFNKSSAAALGDSFEDLYTASVAVWPNCEPNYKLGDAVYVAFADNKEWEPVIIGQLGRDEKTDYCSTINCDSFTTNYDAYLPSLTYIGDVTPGEIECLKGINKNLQFQLEILEQRIAKLEEECNNK